MRRFSKMAKVTLVILTAGLLPVFIGLAARLVLGEAQRIDEGLHAGLELAGATIALAVAMLLWLRARNEGVPRHSFWVVAALLAMGLTDGVHGVARFGDSWSWLRSAATLAGGTLFGLVWAAPPKTPRQRRLALLLVACLATAGAVVILLRPEWFPAPWVSGDFTTLVKAVNMIGGLGFMAATLFFVRLYLREARPEDLVFVHLTLLFAVAALLFGFSDVWAADWWVWHLARLAAFSVLLVAAYLAVRALYRRIAEQAEGLRARVRERTGELELRNAQLEVQIDERKLADQALRQSEEFQNFALETSHTGAWDLDLADHTAFRTLEHDRIFGYAQLLPEWTYEMFLEHVLPEDRPDVDEKFKRAIEKGTDWDFECRIRRPDGTLRWIWAAGRPRADAAGHLRRIAGIVQDITERKRAEEALRESETRFRQLADAAFEGLVIHENGLMLDVNRRVTEMIGYDPAELVGSTFWKYIDPKDHDLVKAKVRREATEVYELELIHSDGRRVPVEVMGRSLLWQGRAVRAAALRDVTERREAGRALRESESKYRQLFENMTEEVHFWKLVRDEQGRILTWRLVDANPPTLKTWGASSIEEIRGKTTDEIFGPGATDHYREMVEKIFGEGVPHSFLDYFPHLDRYFHFTSVPLGEYFIITGSDITGIKKAELALRESENRFRVLTQNLQSGVALIDDRGQFSIVNRSFLRLFDLPDDTDIRNVNDRDWSQWQVFDERGLLLDVDDHPVRKSAMTGQPVREKLVAVKTPSNPDLRWLLISADPIVDERGKVQRLICTYHDITQRKQAEALVQALAEQERLRLGAAVEQASDAIVMIDLEGRIQYVNVAFESSKRTPRNKAVGRSYFDFLPADPSSGEAIRKAFADGQPWHGKLTGPVSGGSPVELDVTLSPATDTSGKLVGGLITEKDVTKENALERQVRQAQKMEALGTLAGGITHDFNNILGTIIINTELALLDLDPANPARWPLPLVLQAANRGKELVKQIITFSRQRAWERKPLEIGPIIKEGMKLLRTTLPRNIVIRETIDAGSGVVLADPSHIHQILVNLCQNAALAMNGGPGRIDVSLRPVEVDAAVAARLPDLEPGPYMLLSVADTGCGMSAEIMERIFEPFFTTRKQGEGSGLGLAVVQGIVKSYEGAIFAGSEPGRGSVFDVYLPRLEGEALTGGSAAPLRPAKGQERILLVEDEEAQRTSLSRGLEQLGYKVTARANGRAALAAFRKKPSAFDLVLTDQIMPGMSGLELAEAIGRIRPDLPVILCTGFSEKVDRGTVGQKGIRELVMKPFTLQEITRAVRATLDKGSQAE